MRKKIFGSIAGLVFAVVITTLASVVLAQTPTLVVESPKNGEVIKTDETLIKFKTENFTLTDFRRKPPPQVGQGHLHFWIDQENPTAQNAINHISKEPYLLTLLEPKEHTLVVELVGNDHSSLDPKVAQTIKFKTTGIPKNKAGTEASPQPTPKAKAFFDKLGSPLIVTTALIVVVILGGVLFYLRKVEEAKANPPVKKPDKVDKQP